MTLIRQATVLAAAAIATVFAAGAAAASTPGTLHFLDLAESATPAFDAGTGAPRPGDRIFLHDRLYTWKDGKRGTRSGHVDATLTFMSAFGAHGATVDISGQMFIPGGSLRVDGIGRVTQGANRFTLPILGGTGVYAAAHGTVDLRDIGTSGSKSAVDIHLVP